MSYFCRNYCNTIDLLYIDLFCELVEPLQVLNLPE